MKVDDETILALIAELRTRSPRRVSGAQVQRELLRRYHARCWTQRVYRLLQLAPTQTPAPPPTPGVVPREGEGDRIAALEDALQAAQAEIAQWRQRAELAEFREQSHVDRWAHEIHALRQEVQRLRQDRRDRLPEGEYLLLKHQLEAAHRRIAKLEEQLLAYR